MQKVFNFNMPINTEGKIEMDISIVKLIADLYCHESKDTYQINPDSIIKVEAAEVPTEDVGTIDYGVNLQIQVFRKKLEFLFKACLLKGPKPWQNPKAIIGEAPGFDICYDKDMILYYQDSIADLLSELKEITSYEDLKTLKDGTNWTVLHEQMNILMSLANAANLIAFKERRENPELTLMRKPIR